MDAAIFCRLCRGIPQSSLSHTIMNRIFILLSLALAWPSLGPGRAEILPPGNRPLPLGLHALTGGKIVVKPGHTLERGSILIRDGLIEAVGPDIEIPQNARVWEMAGLTIYAGFIDPYVAPGSRNSASGSDHDHQHGHSHPPAPDRELTAGGIHFFGVPGLELDPAKRKPGYGSSQITPENRIADSYSPDPKLLASLRELGYAAANFAPHQGILRGASAMVLLGDAEPNRALLNPQVFQHAALETGSRNQGYPASLMGSIALLRQTFYDAQHHAVVHARNHSGPLPTRGRPVLNPSLQALQPVLKKEIPVLFDPQTTLMTGQAHQIAEEFGFKFLILATGQEWRRPDLAQATGAAFIVPLHFPEIPKISDEEDWLDVSLDQLRAWDWAPENPALLRRHGLEIALTTAGLSDRKKFRKNLRAALDRGFSEEDALAALTTIPARLCGVEDQLGTIEAGKLANLTVVQGSSYFDPKTSIREVWVDGRIFPVDFGKENAAASTKDKSGESKDSDSEKSKPANSERVARSPQEGRGPIAEPKSILLHGATLWTSGPAGRIENGAMLIVDGRIAQVGPAPLKLENGFLADADLVLDCQGKHITPGLIDAHSHAMILGGVNEGTLPSTAMVRIADVINSETENIYRQLAGGLTVANLLHGSANPIGGQNAVIKLKDGALPQDLILKEAPSGIKFALGENVKQSNWGERHVTRFPQTRMGVRAFFANRFLAARHYLEAWENYRAQGGLPPRRDLELETLGEILDGRRWIHCHSYRQDEILMFLRLMEQFGVTIGTLQHVLEGYKVADEIAAHGAGASAFSDWWAFKFEVYDAIPYAGSLMRERGVLVSFNSDDADLARRLHLEAAKAVKYGNTSEEEALHFVTINPAKQLRISERTGSLETGKEADFVIWSHSPLDTASVCLETWIEGKKYFDRDHARQRSAHRDQEHHALLKKAKKISGSSDAKSPNTEAEAIFFQIALEHAHDHLSRHCDHE
jgi:imidazolonepropionase-like amidohydrolase